MAIVPGVGSESAALRVAAATVIAATMLAIAAALAPSALADPAPAEPTQPPAPLVVASGEPALVPEGVPHLPSPENPPPGTTSSPVGSRQGHGMSYLRELWHALRTQDVSMDDALLLLTQRPLNPDATPPPGMPAGPQGPVPVTPPAAE